MVNYYGISWTCIPQPRCHFHPRKSVLFVCLSVCLLYLARGAECLIRNPDYSLLHLQIEFLYRSASVIHFPAGSNQYSLTRLKVRETKKTVALMGYLQAPSPQRLSPTGARQTDPQPLSAVAPWALAKPWSCLRLVLSDSVKPEAGRLLGHSMV